MGITKRLLEILKSTGCVPILPNIVNCVDLPQLESLLEDLEKDASSTKPREALSVLRPNQGILSSFAGSVKKVDCGGLSTFSASLSFFNEGVINPMNKTKKKKKKKKKKKYSALI